MSDQPSDLFDRDLPSPGETWLHHEGEAYLILPQDIEAFRERDRPWVHGPFVKYRSVKTERIYLVEQALFMDVLKDGKVVSKDEAYSELELYCRFEKIS